MFTSIHVLLTYACNFECDHCFLYCGPSAPGTFTIAQVREMLDQAQQLGTVESIYFEGGEPFLYYPLLVESIRLARERGFDVGMVTNAYWATCEEDAALWLGPLVTHGIADLSLSDDEYHRGETALRPAQYALAAASALGLPAGAICIEKPAAGGRAAGDGGPNKGAPVEGGQVMFRGRAVDTMPEGLPMRPWTEFGECPFETLDRPRRVHLDPYGHVHLCQGLTMGNMFDRPLPELVERYEATRHPICAPLLRGGPAALAREFGLTPARGFVDACHLCYELRKALLDRFPEVLTPPQVYGLVPVSA